MGQCKELGHCSCCREHVWDKDMPSGTWPGVFANTMLGDGSLMAITLCDACAESPDLDKTWANVLEGWDYEGATSYVSKQSRENFIVAVLYTKPGKTVPIPEARMTSNG